MSPSPIPLQPYYHEFLRCAICAHDFEVDNDLRRPITLPMCGHTMCGQCIDIIRNQSKCPQDQVGFGLTNLNNTSLEQLPTNFPLLAILYDPITLPENAEQRYGHSPSYMKLDDETKTFYQRTQVLLEEIALALKPIVSGKESMSMLSRPMIRKLFALLNCQYIDREGRLKALKAARSLGERTCVDFILHHQNPQQLTANLWSAVRSRGCQFLGPAMQEEVLKLILLALEDGSALSRKVLVLFVVQKLAPQYPRASKTSVGHVVQLLYRASCFKVQKREEESSLMQLKSEFRNYESLRREHDSQIIQIAMEAGLRISPEQWSSLLYGDTQHKSSMQSIIDKLATPASFSQAIQEFLIVLQRAGDTSAHLARLKGDFELIAQIDPQLSDNTTSVVSSQQQQEESYWSQTVQALDSIKTVVQALIDFNWQESRQNGYGHHYHRRNHHSSYELPPVTLASVGTSSTTCSSPMTVSPLGGSSTTSEYQLQPLPPPPVQQPTQAKYKVSMCRDYLQKQSCPRGPHCTFAHSKAEMDRYRAKSRHSTGPILPLAPPNVAPSLPASTLPMFPSGNGTNLVRSLPPPILPLWNPQQQQQQQPPPHLMHEIQQQQQQQQQQQHHHHHYYHPSQIPPSLLHMHSHPATSFEPQQQHQPNNYSQIPVIAAAAQAILEQNTAAANAFYRFQHQQSASMPFHQQPMIVQQRQQQQQQPLLPRPSAGTRFVKSSSDHPFFAAIPSGNGNGGQPPNTMQQRSHSYTEPRFSSVSDHQPTAPFQHIEDLRLPPVLPLGPNTTENSSSTINPRSISVLQTIAAKNDDNLLYFPSINTNGNSRQQTSFVVNSSQSGNGGGGGLFNDILAGNGSISTPLFANNRNQLHKPLSFPTQQARNDENVFYSGHQPVAHHTNHINSLDDDDYALINVSGSGSGGGTSSNDSSFFYFGSANTHATAAYNFYHPNSPLGANGHSLKA